MELFFINYLVKFSYVLFVIKLATVNILKAAPPKAMANVGFVNPDINPA